MQQEARHDASPVAQAADSAGDPQHAAAARAPGRATPAGRRARSARHPERRGAASDGRATSIAAAGAADDATPQTVRKGVISMLVAAAVLLVFNSAGLRTWAHGLPGNAMTDVVVVSADRWHRMMQRAGFAAAMATVQDAVAGLRGQPWPDPDILSAGRADIAKDE